MTSGDNDWKKYEVRYQNNEDENLTIRVQLTASRSAQAFMDCVQLEKGYSSDRHNLVPNCDFRQSGNWTGSGLSTSDTIVTLSSPATPCLDNRVYRLTGNPAAQKRLSQTISVNGNAGDNLIIAGWAKGDSVYLGGSRKFALAQGTVLCVDTMKRFRGQGDGSTVPCDNL